MVLESLELWIFWCSKALELIIFCYKLRLKLITPKILSGAYIYVTHNFIIILKIKYIFIIFMFRSTVGGAILYETFCALKIKYYQNMSIEIP